MIGLLRGEIIYKQAPHLMLDVNGVGYELAAPMSTFYDLPDLGQQTVLFTHLAVREDAHVLYGFVRESERTMFRALLRVSGVGAKMALAILSGMSANEFACAVQSDDTASLVRLPGIGKKTAERLIVEMRDRLDKLEGVTTVAPVAAGAPMPERTVNPEAEAVDALVALGYKPAEASRMVRSVKTEGLASEDIIRAALKAAG
ncbi:Holliday junction ATP-dependent DNA helicase RuvA [hydrothermal vent metagenome]|uniref:Holliday junction ATP-dependent DNA helicase RuvA n=1 Tax=hydrothermal vent metagenome TaxID=652676 RepID=A0A3B1APW0_9ZZZZ